MRHRHRSVRVPGHRTRAWRYDRGGLPRDRFIVALPLVAVEPAPAPGARAEFSAARRRVLVVDDEQEMRDVLGDILTIANHDVRLCTAGTQALELLSQEHFNAIISDVRKPGMDGVDLSRHVQARWPDLAQRMVFMTGDSLSATHQQYIFGIG